MNHNGLFINLMKLSIPVELLNVFENWFSTCYYTSVKWFSCFSSFSKLECGVRQGGVLFPYFKCSISDAKKSFTVHLMQFLVKLVALLRNIL